MTLIYADEFLTIKDEIESVDSSIRQIRILNFKLKAHVLTLDSRLRFARGIECRASIKRLETKARAVGRAQIPFYHLTIINI